MADPYGLLCLLARFELQAEQVESLRGTLAKFDAWDAFAQLAELHGMAPLAYRHIAKHDLPCLTKAALVLRTLTNRHRRAAAIRHRVLGEIVDALQARDIEPIGIKGVALAPLLYPEPGLRPMRDMDILVDARRASEAADALRGIGFTLPHSQPSRFDVLNHHLPNATREVDGMTVSVELHTDAVTNDSFTRIDWNTACGSRQPVDWDGLRFHTLGHELMLEQVCRHLASPQQPLKLINVVDAVAYADRYAERIDWPRLAKRRPFVVNALRCLHQLTPWPDTLRARLDPGSKTVLKQAGQNMIPVSSALQTGTNLKTRLHNLFNPGEWWLHLHYAVPPGNSLLLTRTVVHPFYLGWWFVKRMVSWLLWRKA